MVGSQIGVTACGEEDEAAKSETVTVERFSQNPAAGTMASEDTTITLRAKMDDE